MIASVAVFCGSRFGHDPRCAAAATALGAALARTGRRLVYGGGRVGLMGLVADAVLAGGGRVLGVIPEFLTRMEVAHHGVPDLVVTRTMHERKARMFAEADAFVGLPGGLGTLEELFEIVTWRQLGQHDKPIVICDVAGSARGFEGAIDAAIAGGFVGTDCHRLYEIAPDVPAVLAALDRAMIDAGAANADKAAAADRL